MTRPLRRSSTGPRSTLAGAIGVAVAVVAAVAGAIPGWAGTPVVAAAPPAVALAVIGAAATTTPLLSVRRVARWVAGDLAQQRMAASLAPLVAPAALGSGTACLVVEQGGQLITSLRATSALLPASNLKVLTATAALDRLGPSYRYTTTVAADRAPSAGVVDGNLYLVGGGDPVLRTPQYEASLPDTVPPYTSLPELAAQVRAAGVTRVTGTVVGDESRYDRVRSVATWLPVYTAEGDVGPMSALDVNDGFAPTPGGFGVPAQPAQGAAQTFTALLAAAGVDVVGRTAVAGGAPATAVRVTSIRSAPLSRILSAILAPSDDTAAEVLTKELGRVAGTGGTTAAGVAVVRADLGADGLPVAGLVALDGSGLDRSDRATCGLVAGALAREQPAGTLAADLAVAGSTGTLAHRLAGTPAAGRVRAKTGTLHDVSALSGYVLASPTASAPTLRLRAPLVFSLIMDGVAVDRGVAIGNRVAVALAGYPAPPLLSSLEPSP